MRVELEAMEKNETWEDAELPKGRTLVGYVWTVSIKQHENLPRYKVRLWALLNCMAWTILRRFHR